MLLTKQMLYVLPEMDSYTATSNIYSLHFTPEETESVLKSLKTGKAIGPDGINNIIPRELSKEHRSILHTISLLRQVPFHNVGKSHTYVQFMITELAHCLQTTVLSPFCILQQKMERAVFKHLSQ